MNILIIGGTRFIGYYTLCQLAAQGHNLTLFHRNPTPLQLPEGVQEILGDRRQWDSQIPALRAKQPEVVLDMIPVVEQDAISLTKTFSGHAGRVALISSCDVYRAYGRLIKSEPGDPVPAPASEDAPLREKRFPYRGETPRPEDDPRRILDDYDKIPIEQHVLSQPDLPGTVLRLPMVYGPYDYQHRLHSYLQQMDSQVETISLDPQLAQWRGARGYVENVAHAITLAVANPQAAGRVYNVAEPWDFTEHEWVEQIGRAVGWNGQVVISDESEDSDADYRQDLTVDTRRLREEMGYDEIVPLQTALEKTIEWERAHPPA